MYFVSSSPLRSFASRAAVSLARLRCPARVAPRACYSNGLKRRARATRGGSSLDASPCARICDHVPRAVGKTNTWLEARSENISSRRRRAERSGLFSVDSTPIDGLFAWCSARFTSGVVKMVRPSPFPGARAPRVRARARSLASRRASSDRARVFFSAREALQRKISSPRRGRRRRLDAAAIARARVRASRCPRDASETAFTTRPGWTTAADAANCASTDARVLGLSPASSSHLRQRALTLSSPRSPRLAAVPKDVQDQEDPGQEAEAEQAHPPVDPHAHRQHHQVRVRGDPSCPPLCVEKFQDLGQEIDRSIDPRRERPTDRPPPSSFSHRSSGTTPSVATGAAPSSASDRCDGPGRGLTVWTVHGAVAPLARD